MRVSIIHSLPVVIAALAAVGASACGSDSPPGDGGGGDASTSSKASTSHSGTGGGGTTSSGGGATSSTSSSPGTGGGGGAPPACEPKASCMAGKACISLTDNSSSPKAGLRISELDLSAPPALTSGLVATVLSGAVLPQIAACNLNGTATFNWLLQFDAAAGTIKTGGAQSVTDPATGYAFDDETVEGVHIQPATLTAAVDAGGAFDVTTGQDLNLPVFLGSGTPLVLPLKLARFTAGTLSADKNCIGSYNAENLSPDAMCLPTSTVPAFLDAASIDAHITLEDADGIIIDPLSESLCVVLSGDAATFGDGGTPTKCKRAGGTILFAGDWCDATNAAAAGGCADAVRLEGRFAASAVKITN